MHFPGYNSLKNSHRWLAVLSAPSISETSLSSSFSATNPPPFWLLDVCLAWRQMPLHKGKTGKNSEMKLPHENLLWISFWWHISIPRGLKCICCTFFSLNNVYCLDYIFCETLHGPLLARDKIAAVGLQFSSQRVITHKERKSSTP